MKLRDFAFIAFFGFSLWVFFFKRRLAVAYLHKYTGVNFMNTVNQATIDLIKKEEGLRLEAYPDPGTGGEPFTIGYGHTGGVKEGDVITEAKAEELLRRDIGTAVIGVSGAVNVKLNDNQFGACVSLAYNIGVTNFKKSSLLAEINKGNFEIASAKFPNYNKANGHVMAGLTKRREAERDLFNMA